MPGVVSLLEQINMVLRNGMQLTFLGNTFFSTLIRKESGTVCIHDNSICLLFVMDCIDFLALCHSVFQRDLDQGSADYGLPPLFVA